jgi:redox-sensitive bicupin YhaK (pirin superfamily)
LEKKMSELIQLIAARPTQDGDGVKIHRLAGRMLYQALNPFLMIDEINSDDATDYIGGFPEHPHRGFETITYMKAGRMRHRDHMGNEGVIAPGDVQWMTAGAGVLHSEMPEQEQGLLHGFQIWLNLPAAEKMNPAAYREIVSSEITQQRLSDGGMVRVIAGNVTVNQQSLRGPLPGRSTHPVLIDVQLAANETVELSIDTENQALVYAYKGATDLITARQLGIYANGRKLVLKAGPSGAELLVLSGQPINEPLVQYGPFVMNTSEEIEQAINDFQNPQFLSKLKRNLGSGNLGSV